MRVVLAAKPQCESCKGIPADGALAAGCAKSAKDTFHERAGSASKAGRFFSTLLVVIGCQSDHMKTRRCSGVEPCLCSSARVSQDLKSLAETSLTSEERLAMPVLARLFGHDHGKADHMACMQLTSPRSFIDQP